MKYKFTLLIVAACFLLNGTITAQKKMPDESIKKIDQNTLIASIGKLLKERYLYVDSAAKMHDFLLERHKNGAYKHVRTARELGREITKDLLANFHDRHLSVMYAPRLVEMLNAGTPSEPSQEEIDAELNVEVYKNFQLPEMRVMKGNIGYLRIDTFLPPRYARGYAEKIMACFEFLGDTEALIIDLRENPGGYGDGVEFFLSYLLPPNTHISTEVSRIPNGGMMETLGYSGSVEGRAYLEKPLYILTSPRTASAAEATAHALKYSNRATIVGEYSYGAGYLGDDFPVDDKYIMRISYAVGKHPNAPGNWEGVGVEPDIQASYGQAEIVARERIVQELLNLERKKSKDQLRESVTQALEWESKRLKDIQNPLILDAEQVEEYVGKYENRRILLIDGVLYYYRSNPDRPKRKMIPIAKDEFLLEGLDDYRIGFDRDKKTFSIGTLRLYSVDRLLISKKDD
ncbi:MAG: S41 family peptidase [Ekhidna sp.]